MAIGLREQVVWMFPLQLVDRQEVELPRGAKPLTIINRNEQAVLYAVVDPTQTEKETRIIWCHGTGHRVAKPDTSSKYIATTLFANGRLVFHWFLELDWTDVMKEHLGSL